MFERTPEQLARHMVLLSIATDWELPIRTRAHLWLEVYGNALVQARTSAYLAQRRVLLADLLCSGRGPAPLPALLDAYSLLRHRHRDEVEGVLKTWAEEVAFDIALYRDTRVRAALGSRYDSLENVADWDYQMVIKPAAGCVHGKQYRAWRASGIAFEYGDQTYDRPNRTLGSYAEARTKKRGSIMARGYWGDTVVSPYHAIGTAAYVPTDAEASAAAAAVAPTATVATAASEPSQQPPKKGKQPQSHAGCLFDVLNRRYGSEQWRHHSVELATYNLLAWLSEIETGAVYVMGTENDIYSGLPVSGSSAPDEPSTAVEAEAGSAEVSAEGSAAEPAAGASSAASSQSAAPPPLAPPPMLTPAEAAALQASVRAAALCRARTISRAFKGVTVTLVSGDFKEDFLDRSSEGGINHLAGLFHVVALSNRSSHHLGHAAFPELFAPLSQATAAAATAAVEAAPPTPSPGSLLLVETGRNVTLLSAAQRSELVKRIVCLGGQAGAVVLGGDRALSADTFSVGTVISPGEISTGPAGGRAASAAAGAGTQATTTPAAPAPLYFAAPPGGGVPCGPCAQPEPLGENRGGSTFAGRPPAFTGKHGAAAAGGEGEDSSSTPARPVRAKCGGIAAFSHSEAPMAPIARLAAAAAGGGAAVKAAAREAAEEAWGLASGVDRHACWGGDNPMPEALAFAWLGRGVAAEVGAAFREAEARGAASGSEGAGQAESSSSSRGGASGSGGQ